jgi:hypothetical protein
MYYFTRLSHIVDEFILPAGMGSIYPHLHPLTRWVHIVAHLCICGQKYNSIPVSLSAKTRRVLGFRVQHTDAPPPLCGCALLARLPPPARRPCALLGRRRRSAAPSPGSPARASPLAPDPLLARRPFPRIPCSRAAPSPGSPARRPPRGPPQLAGRRRPEGCRGIGGSCLRGGGRGVEGPRSGCEES